MTHLRSLHEFETNEKKKKKKKTHYCIAAKLVVFILDQKKKLIEIGNSSQIVGNSLCHILAGSILILISLLSNFYLVNYIKCCARSKQVWNSNDSAENGRPFGLELRSHQTTLQSHIRSNIANSLDEMHDDLQVVICYGCWWFHY